MGIKSIIDSNIINFTILDFSKPRTLRTKFWWTLSIPITFIALDITKNPINITILDIKILTINNLFKKDLVLSKYSDNFI